MTAWTRSIHKLSYLGRHQMVRVKNILDVPSVEDFLDMPTPVAGTTWVPRQGVWITHHGATRKQLLPASLTIADDIRLCPVGPALDALRPLLEPWGELLPVDVEGQPGAVFHCLNTIDALDLDLAEPAYASDDPEKVLAFGVWAFKPDTVPAGCAFVLPEKRGAELYYTGELVAAMNEAIDTTGVIFPAVWTAQEGPISPPKLLDADGRATILPDYYSWGDQTR